KLNEPQLTSTQPKYRSQARIRSNDQGVQHRDRQVVVTKGESPNLRTLDRTGPRRFHHRRGIACVDPGIRRLQLIRHAVLFVRGDGVTAEQVLRAKEGMAYCYYGSGVLALDFGE